jgi:hypothetical protein
MFVEREGLRNSMNPLLRRFELERGRKQIEVKIL